MKKNLILTGCLCFIFSFSACRIAYDDTIHTANLYFYNYSDEPIIADHEPLDFKCKEKFRQKKTDYIYPNTDDLKKSTPDISYNWVPGEFYLAALSDNESQRYLSGIKLYKDKRKKLDFHYVNTWKGIPSAEDYDCHFCIVKTFTKDEYLKDDFLQTLEKITNNSDKSTFASCYVECFNSEDNYYYYSRAETLSDIFMNKNQIRDTEKIIEKYGLEKGPDAYIVFLEEKRGALNYEYRDY